MDFTSRIPDELANIADTGAAIGVGNFLTGQVSVSCNYRPDWQELYQSKGWVSKDPVVMAGLQGSDITRWPLISETLSPVLMAAHDFGIRSGIIISDDVSGSKCIAGLSSGRLPSKATRQQAQFLVREMHLDHLANKALNLTVKQKELVYLFATGKRSAEVGFIMGISISTINQYKTTITGSLGLNSFIAAINICARAGLTYHPIN